MHSDIFQGLGADGDTYTSLVQSCSILVFSQAYAAHKSCAQGVVNNISFFFSSYGETETLWLMTLGLKMDIQFLQLIGCSP